MTQTPSPKESGHGLRALAEAARRAARTVAKTSAEQRKAGLLAIATSIERRTADILDANARDMVAAKGTGEHRDTRDLRKQARAASEPGIQPTADAPKQRISNPDIAPLSAAMLDRLRLDEPRVAALARAVREIAGAPEVLGRVDRTEKRPNGLEVSRVRIPLGVIAMIYEARPNVTTDAAALCLKSGNACILRGGSEAIESNRALLSAVRQGLADAKLPMDTVQLVPMTDREAIAELVKLDDLIDLCIPRGGEGLIRYVAEHARVPVIKHYKGVCHVFVHAAADPAIALRIVDNAKTSRPGVCNALETLLVDRAIAPTFLPMLVKELDGRVELRGDNDVRKLGGPAIRSATEEDWFAEYLDLVLAVRVVDGLDGAIKHIERYGSNHTESIVTTDTAAAERFLREVDSSTVMVNASTRFADGGELGLGAEIGISTTRLHAYGPMGAEGLTTTKFVVRGNGQIR